VVFNRPRFARAMREDEANEMHDTYEAQAAAQDVPAIGNYLAGITHGT
jgi:hypothetical protein